MLQNNASFSIYMAHGGTTFGFWTGADRPFKPDTSSYDYDAPISEAGWPTDKFFKTRELFAKYLLPGETIPEPPAKNPVISLRAGGGERVRVTLRRICPHADRRTRRPGNFEKYDQAYGLHSLPHAHRLPATPRRSRPRRCMTSARCSSTVGASVLWTGAAAILKSLCPPRRKNAARSLDILVEAMGRVNFGAEVHDRKGLIGPVNFIGRAVRMPFHRWQIFKLAARR